MKNILFSAFALTVLLSCSTNSENSENFIDETTNSNASARTCPSDEIRANLLSTDPAAKARFTALENGTEKFIQDKKAGRVLVDGTIEIPVIVNVIYNTPAENVSDARIAEQITVLNEDFGANNLDVNRIPAEFANVAAGNTKIRFSLVATNRRQNNTIVWRIRDDMKRAIKGGIAATRPLRYLNIWVVNKMIFDKKNILGYGLFPESAGDWNDGVVIAAHCFGKTGASAPFNLGRTATHEVGHYLNLRHIWGDANCGTDFVNDTPTQISQNEGSPVYPLNNICGGVNRSVMFMNYMDYVNDNAMFMFSAGQRDRMQAALSILSARSGLRSNFF